jgi:predicted RNA-binding protein (TIGR00451 family)
LKKWVVSKSESVGLVKEMEGSLGVSLNLSRSAQASCEEPDDEVVFVHFGDSVFVKAAGRYLPFLGSPAALDLFRTATVDEGAIKYVLNGADIMRPGVRTYEDWGDSGRLVVVREEKKGRSIAVAESMVSSEEMRGMAKGPCLKNLHRVGDRYWILYKTV